MTHMLFRPKPSRGGAVRSAAVAHCSCPLVGTMKKTGQICCLAPQWKTEAKSKESSFLERMKYAS